MSFRPLISGKLLSVVSVNSALISSLCFNQISKLLAHVGKVSQHIFTTSLYWAAGVAHAVMFI